MRRSVLGGGNGTCEGPEMEKSWDLLGNFTKAFSGRYPMSTAVHVVCVCVWIGRGERQSKETWGGGCSHLGER